MIVEIVYFVVQRYLRNIISIIENYQTEDKFSKYFIDVNLLKKINYSVSDCVSMQCLRNASSWTSKVGRPKKHRVTRYDIRYNNGLLMYYDYGDDDYFYYDFEEELKEICDAYMQEWFVCRLYANL